MMIFSTRNKQYTRNVSTAPSIADTKLTFDFTKLTPYQKNTSTPKCVLSSFEDDNQRTSDIARKIQKIVSHTIVIKQNQSKHKKIISQNTLASKFNKNNFDIRPHSNIKEKVSDLKRDFESKIRYNQLKKENTDKEFLNHFSNKKREILSLLKPTEREKSSSMLRNIKTSESTSKLDRYNKLYNRMKGAMDFEHVPNVKKSFRLNLPYPKHY